MQLTKRQIASRANGAKSQGPKTEHGKRRSAFNATRHGLLSRVCVLKGEDAEAFSILCRQHIEKLQPRDQAELNCVEEMCSAAWRLRRYTAIESELLDLAIADRKEPRFFTRLTRSFSQLANGPELNLLARYETRLSRLYRRSFENLMLLRQFESNSEAEEPEVEFSAPDPQSSTPPASPDPEPDPEPDPAPQPAPETTTPNEPTAPQPPADSTASPNPDEPVRPSIRSENTTSRDLPSPNSPYAAERLVP